MPKTQLIGTQTALEMINAARLTAGHKPIKIRALQRFYVGKMAGTRIGRSWVFRLTDVERLVETIKRGQA